MRLKESVQAEIPEVSVDKSWQVWVTDIMRQVAVPPGKCQRIEATENWTDQGVPRNRGQKKPQKPAEQNKQTSKMAEGGQLTSRGKEPTSEALEAEDT